MMARFRAFSDRLLGRGSAALTVPPLDGALKPNTLLEDAARGTPATAPRGLVLREGQLIWSQGARVVSHSGRILDAGGQVTALAVAPGGDLAVAAEGQGIRIGDARPAALAGLSCVTGLCYDAQGALWIALGSSVNGFDDWKRDFLDQRRAGSLLRMGPGSDRPQVVAQDLGFPWGLMADADGVVVAESWAKRLVHITPEGRRRVLADDLPGYPAGIAPSAGGGAWLALFAPRSPLLELVLREPKYRREMMAEVPQPFWIAPALGSGRSFLEPMQGGALKQMGILKPWAPSLSAGLVVELNSHFVPVRSFHSRAGGQRHGITAVLEAGRRLHLTATGGDEVFSLPLNGEGR